VEREVKADRQARSVQISQAMGRLGVSINRLHVLVDDIRGPTEVAEKTPGEDRPVPSIGELLSSLPESLAVAAEEIDSAIKEIREMVV